MMIDVHNHVIPREVLDLLERDPSYGVSFANGAMKSRSKFEFPLPPAFFDPTAKLAELDAHELDAAVLSIAPPAFLYEVGAEKSEALCAATNLGLARFATAAPDRFRWMAHVPMAHLDRAIPMLREAKAEGAVGVELATQIGPLRVDDPSFAPFWRAVEELGLLVMPHPFDNAPYPGLGDWYLQNVIGNPLETMILGCRLICSGVLDRHPGARVLLVHGGGHLPYQLGRLRHAAEVRPELANAPRDPWAYMGQLVFDTLTHDVQALTYLVDRVGGENVVVGTDLPFDMSPRMPVSALREAVGERAALQIGADNPREILGWTRSAR
jgi:aminocarboxymuconate-semialdehyde decarboxylase